MLAGMEWKCLNWEKQWVEETGWYFICDGGYHYWKEMIAPYKHQISGSRLEQWSKNLESIRKDAECTFGILKMVKKYQNWAVKI